MTTPASPDARACRGVTTAGVPCNAPPHWVGEDGYCHAHREGGLERQRALSAKGGEANRARILGAGFAHEELPPLVTIEDAKAALDAIRSAILTRKVTHNEGGAAARAVAEWVKATTAQQTERVVNELQRELEAKTSEVAELRKLLARPVYAKPQPVVA